MAVHQTYGAGGRLQLPKLFDAWEKEALELANAAEERPEVWGSVQKRRALVAKSPFAQGLLSVCHRDVVREAQVCGATRRASRRVARCDASGRDVTPVDAT